MALRETNAGEELGCRGVSPDPLLGVFESRVRVSDEDGGRDPAGAGGVDREGEPAKVTCEPQEKEDELVKKESNPTAPAGVERPPAPPGPPPVRGVPGPAPFDHDHTTRRGAGARKPAAAMAWDEQTVEDEKLKEIERVQNDLDDTKSEFRDLLHRLVCFHVGVLTDDEMSRYLELDEELTGRKVMLPGETDPEPWPRLQPGVELPKRPEIVVICGSTRFKQQIMEVNRNETMLGRIVLAPGVFGHAGDRLTDEDKLRLDELHLAKIDLSDEVIVVCPGGYIGESPAREIEYARRAGKPITKWS